MVELLADGGSLCAAPIPLGFPAGFGLLSSQCGMNSPSPVSPEYLAPNVFTGTLREVEIELGEDDRVAIEGLWAAALKRQ